MGMMVGCKTGFTQTYPNPVYPLIGAAVGQAFVNDTTAHAITMVSGLTAGQLIWLPLTSDGSATVTTPAGWTEIYSILDPANGMRAGLYCKISDGTESGTTVDFVTSAAERALASVYRFTGWGGTIASDVGYATAGAWNVLDTPEITSGWGYVPTRWGTIWHASVTHTFSAAPSGYTDVISGLTGIGTDHCQHRIGWKTTALPSENPGAWNITGITGSFLVVLAYIK